MDMKRGLPPAGGYPSLDYADIAAAIEKRLFVGQVPPGTTEDELRSVFEAFGGLISCRVVADHSGKADGFAFVSFETWGAAHRALVETDGRYQLHGHAGTPNCLSVSFAEPNSSVGRGSLSAYAKGLDIARLFVGALPENATEGEIVERFQIVGKVEGANMLPAKAQRLRCGFVNVQTWGEALDAVEQLAGQPLRAGGEPMTVVLAQPKDCPRDTSGLPPNPAARGKGGGALAFGGGEALGPLMKARRLEANTQAESVNLAVLLAAYGAAVNGDGPREACDLLHQEIMKTREAMRAQAARQALLGSALLGAAPGLSLAPGSALGQPTASAFPGAVAGADANNPHYARLFVGGLPHDCTDEDLANLAGQLQFRTPPAGCQLLECRVLKGKGCGYIRYSSQEAAEEAFAALQCRQVEGWTNVLRVQWSAPKGASISALPTPALPGIGLGSCLGPGLGASLGAGLGAGLGASIPGLGGIPGLGAWAQLQHADFEGGCMNGPSQGSTGPSGQG